MSRAPKPEKAILNEALVALSALPGALVYRNNTGQGWQGQRMQVAPGGMVEVLPGMVILMNARPITFGLPGSGDIMGAVQGRPLAAELKTALGTQSQLQKDFASAWTKAGGIYVLARSAEQAVSEVVARLPGDDLLAL